MAPTLAEAAYHTIRDRILSGDLTPSSTLTERALAEQSGISRTPLRNAIQRLENEGVLMRLQNGALLVREVTIEQMIEIIEVRQILEPEAAARAAAAVECAENSGHLSALQKLHQDMQSYAAGNLPVSTFWQADDALHLTIARLAGYAILPGILHGFRETSRRCPFGRGEMHVADQAREHQDILDAIFARDPGGARTAMHQHFERMRRRIIDQMIRRGSAPCP